MRVKQKTCRICKETFTPDRYNAHHQYCCTRPDCQATRHYQNQRNWLKKNPNHHNGKPGVLRVQLWRAANPGKSRKGRKKAMMKVLIADIFVPVSPAKAGGRIKVRNLKTGELQDFAVSKVSGNKGVIAKLLKVLQDFIKTLMFGCYFSRIGKKCGPVRKKTGRRGKGKKQWKGRMQQSRRRRNTHRVLKRRRGSSKE